MERTQITTLQSGERKKNETFSRSTAKHRTTVTGDPALVSKKTATVSEKWIAKRLPDDVVAWKLTRNDFQFRVAPSFLFFVLSRLPRHPEVGQHHRRYREARFTLAPLSEQSARASLKYGRECLPPGDGKIQSTSPFFFFFFLFVYYFRFLTRNTFLVLHWSTSDTRKRNDKEYEFACDVTWSCDPQWHQSRDRRAHSTSDDV